MLKTAAELAKVSQLRIRTSVPSFSLIVAETEIARKLQKNLTTRPLGSNHNKLRFSTRSYSEFTFVLICHTVSTTHFVFNLYAMRRKRGKTSFGENYRGAIAKTRSWTMQILNYWQFSEMPAINLKRQMPWRRKAGFPLPKTFFLTAALKWNKVSRHHNAINYGDISSDE